MILRIHRFLVAAAVLLPICSQAQQPTDAGLEIELIAAPNFVVDSNIETPAGKSPEAAHLGVKVCNTGATTLTDIYVNIGDLTDTINVTGTAGIYPQRTQAPYVGTFSITHEGPASDATRYIAKLEPGECSTQYWLVSYPLLDDNGDSVTGGVKPDDDLWLNYSIWANATDGASTRKVYETRTATMRNEISAMANKIWPNGDNKVPQEYLDAIEAALGWRPPAVPPSAGEVGALEGVWYDLGNVGQGFDNDGDLVPDRNIWMQPVGDPSLYDPTCTRLVHTYGLVIVKLNDGSELLIPFEDQLYFTDIPENNTGAVGLVFYEFATLNSGCSSQLTPYQEVASGFDNEKFNGDYGNVVGGVSVGPAEMSFAKSVDSATTALPGTLNYTLTATNDSTTTALGKPELGVPLVLQDSIPTGTEYVAASAAAGNTVPAGVTLTVVYSTDGGTTFTETEPSPASAVTDIQWWLNEELPATESVSVTFGLTVPAIYPEVQVNNTGGVSFGNGTAVLEDSASTLVLGNNSISGTVFEDDGSGANFANGVLDTGDPGEVGIGNITITLYFDEDGDGEGDTVALTTTSSAVDGSFSFASLPDGNYTVEIDTADGDLPATFGITTSREIGVDLDSGKVDANPVVSVDNDFGFAPPLSIDKVEPTATVLEGQQLTYPIRVTNNLALPPSGVYTAWAGALYSGGGSDMVSAASGLGAPDGAYAESTWTVGVDKLNVQDHIVSAPSGNVVTVELLIALELEDALMDDDKYVVEVVDGGTTLLTFDITPAELDAFYQSPGTFVRDVTSIKSWSWTDFSASSTMHVDTDATKVTSFDAGPPRLRVDAIGYRVTTSLAGGGGSSSSFDEATTLIDVALRDQYDPAELEFVSASVAPSSVNTITGEILWDDIGPINAGETVGIDVTFRALRQTGDTVYQWLDNDADITNATFVNGVSANLPADTTEVAMNPTGTIAGRVWADIDGDGWQPGTTPGNNGYEVGELGVAGATVTLHICDTAPPTTGGSRGTCTGNETLVVTTTDANGDYFFDGLTSSLWYSVVVDPTTVPGAPAQTGDPDDDAINGGNGGTCGGGGGAVQCTDSWTNGDAWTQLSVGGWTDAAGVVQQWEITNINFGYSGVTPSIFGYVWHDLDGDGVWDANETPISGAIVTASWSGVTGTATTAADGSYVITQNTGGGALIAGVPYTLTVSTLPAGATWTNTFESATNDFAIANGDPAYNNGMTFAIAGATEQSGNWNFGFQCTGTLQIGDTVFVDFDGDGIFDVGESGLLGVDVALWMDLDGDGVATPGVDFQVGTDTTDGSGNYLFSNLPNGDYLVVVDESTLPTGYWQTSDPDESGATCTTCDAYSDVTLSGATNLDQDFGYQPSGSGTIGDFVFADSNGDGVVGTGETGIADITVTLLVDIDDNGSYETTLGTTSTDANGAYSFGDLPAGEYRVVVDTADPQLPVDSNSNVHQVTTGATIDITLAAGGTDLSADFGFAGPSSIGDFVFYDDNGNGLQDYTEVGIANVTVNLFVDANEDGIADTPGTPVATTTTADGTGLDPSGFYEFTGVSPGTYVVIVDTTTLPTVGGSPITMTSDPDRDGVTCLDTTYGVPPAIAACDHADSFITVGFNGAYQGADFGYQPSGVVGDYVWLDQDNDGVQDAGEPGLPGVEVQISDGTTTLTVTTDPDGRYTFANLDDGNWTVTVTAANFLSGGALEGRSQTYDADGTGSANSTALVITGGEVTSANNPGWCSSSDCSLDLDFGYRLAGDYSLAGGVCLNDSRVVGTCDDVDNFTDDGVDRDAGVDDEIELQNIAVYLYTDSGTYLGQTVTAADGSYQFDGLPDGDYQVVIGTNTAPLDLATLTTTAANNAAVSDVDSSSGTSVIQDVTIAGADVSNVDYAFTSSVNFDFGDLPDSYHTSFNADGARHIIPGGGSTIFLGSNAPDADVNGAPSGHADSDDILGATPDDEDGVTAVSSSTWTNGTVAGGDGGSVNIEVTAPNGNDVYLVGWVDFNQDGDLTDPDEMIVSQSVSGTGSSQTVSVDFDIPAGTLDGNDQAFLYRFRIFDSEPPFPLFSYFGAVDDGEVEDGKFEITTGASIGDFVWVDSDGDGVFDTDEEGLGGVTVTLAGTSGASVVTSDGTQDVDGDGVVDPLGYYRFTGLAAGNYSVTITEPAGFTNSFDKDSGTVSPDDTTGSFAVAANEQVADADFGLEPLTANISGTVYDDLGSDDTLNGAGETPISGVTVQLWTDPNGDGDPSDGLQVGETTTDGSGGYLFSNVPTGDYVVVEIDPSNAISDADTDGANDNRIGVDLVGGSDSTGNDFLDDLPPYYTISGSVYDDDDATNNNTIGAEDTVIGGVEIQLYADNNNDGLQDGGDTLLATVYTDTSGDYSFAGVFDGDYVVVETNPSGYSSDADTDGANDDTIEADIAGADNSGNNFLDDGGSLNSIGGTVYDDDDTTDNDTIGVEDAAVSGVTIELFSDLDGDGVFDSGEPLIATTTTDTSGNYLFENLPDGDYVIVETDPAGSSSEADTDGVATDNNVGVSLSGSDSTGNDFLDDGSDPLGIGDRIFIDADGDNTFDAGEGLSGVTVELWATGEDPNGAGSPVATTTSGADGFYVFEGLAAGDYFVHVPKEEFQSGGDLEDKVSLGGATDDGTTDNDDNGIDARLPDTSGISSREFSLSVAGAPTDDDETAYSGGLSDSDLNLTADLGFQAAKPFTWPEFQDVYDTELDHTSSPGTNDQPGDNPDGDIWDNLKEYAFCLNPGSGLENHPGWCVEADVNGDLDVKFIRRLGGLSDVKYTVQGAAALGDPTTWTDLISIDYGSDLPAGATATPTASGLGEEVTVTDIETYAPLTDSIGFTRIKIELDTDADGNADVTTFTQVSGWQETTTFAQCETCSVPFLKKESFSGGVVSLTAPDSLEVSASLASGQNLGAALLTGGQFYVEVIAGDHEGQRWEVNEVASDADTIVLNLSSMYNTSATVLSTIAGDQIVVRKHWTLGEVVPLADVEKTNSPGTADKVLFYDSTGTFTSAVGSYEILWAMDFLSTQQWRSMDSGDTSDHSSRIIGPCEGFYIHRSSSGGTLKHVGLVRENKFCCPLVAGSNLFPNPYPVDASAADWNMSVATGFTGSDNPSQADQIMLWMGDGVQGPQEFGGNFLMDWTVGGTNYTWWAPIAGDSGLTNENEVKVFKRNRSTFIKSISGKADFCVPPNWSP